MLTIGVCVKQVFDPEAPVSLFEIDYERMKVLPPAGMPPVLSPFDENALEAALRIKEQVEAKIIVFSAGHKLALPILRKVLAVGADEFIALDDKAFAGMDSYCTANVLAAAIEKAGGCDLVLCGRQAADTNAGHVGLGIAELLGLPAVTLAGKLWVEGSTLHAERMKYDGCESVSVQLPALATVSNEVGELRIPLTRAVIAARKQEVPVWKASDLDLDTGLLKRTELLDLQKYDTRRQSACKIVDTAELADVIAGQMAGMAN